MSVESKQAKIEIIRDAKEIGENTCERVAETLTLINDEKLEKNGSNLIQQDIDSLRIKLGISNASDVTYIDKIGTIETTASTVIINLDVSGENKIYFNNVSYSVYDTTILNYTPVSADKIKVVILYALPTADLFYLAEGEEGFEAKDPDIPAGALLIKRITVTPEGQYIDPNLLAGYKEKVEDNWKKIIFIKGTSFIVEFNDKRQCFYLNQTPKNSAAPTIISNVLFSEESTRSFLFRFYNNSNADIQINASDSDDLLKGFSGINTPFILKPKMTVFAVFDPETDLIDIVKMSGEGGIVSLNLSNVFTGNGSTTPLDVKEASTSQRGTMSAAHWNKLESIDFSGLTNLFVPIWNGLKFINSIIYQSSGGRIGIGTTSPAETLDVAGRGKFNSIVFGANIGTPVNWEFGRKDGVLGYADGAGTWKKLQDIPQISINSSTLTTLTKDAENIGQNGKSVIIDNTSNSTISIESTSESNFVAAYVKTGAGTLSFTAGAGVTITQFNGTNVITSNARALVVRIGSSNNYILYA